MQQHYLYRHFDKDNVLLYIGISHSAFIRFATHKVNAGWVDSASTMTIEKFDSREDVQAAEKAAIKTEKPLWNISHNTFDYLPEMGINHVVKIGNVLCNMTPKALITKCLVLIENGLNYHPLGEIIAALSKGSGKKVPSLRGAYYALTDTDKENSHKSLSNEGVISTKGIKKITIRFSDEEYAELESLKQDSLLSINSIIRLLITNSATSVAPKNVEAAEAAEAVEAVEDVEDVGKPLHQSNELLDVANTKLHDLQNDLNAALQRGNRYKRLLGDLRLDFQSYKESHK